MLARTVHLRCGVVALTEDTSRDPYSCRRIVEHIHFDYVDRAASILGSKQAALRH